MIKPKPEAESTYREADTEEKERFRCAAEFVKSLNCSSSMIDGRQSTKSHRRISRSSGIEGGTNIGGLGERSLHLVLKYYLESDNSYHEQKLGRYYADILRDGEAIEIQTRSFFAFRNKIDAISARLPVTVVHPIVAEKSLVWIDPESGEFSGFRKSPKREDIFGVFREVYSLKELLERDNISFLFPVLKCEEYKLKCGWSADGKKGSVRMERIPTELCGEYRFRCAADFLSILPKSLLNRSFTISDAASEVGLSYRTFYSFLGVLRFAGVVEACGKDGRKGIFKVSKSL